MMISTRHTFLTLFPILQTLSACTVTEYREYEVAVQDPVHLINTERVKLVIFNEETSCSDLLEIVEPKVEAPDDARLRFQRDLELCDFYIGEEMSLLTVVTEDIPPIGTIGFFGYDEGTTDFSFTSCLQRASTDSILVTPVPAPGFDASEAPRFESLKTRCGS